MRPLRPTAVRTALWMGTLWLLSACAGPNFHFDPTPVPGWIHETTKGVGTQEIRMVGVAPVTSHVQRDVELATRDAKARVAQMFASQVVSRTTDWAVSTGGSSEGDRQITQQNIEVRTNVKVEDVTVAGTYRDKATKTQYVRIIVDRVAWTRRLEKRLGNRTGQVTEHIAAGDSALAEDRPLRAYASVLEGYKLGREIQTDVIVLDLLKPNAGIRDSLLANKRRLNELRGLVQDNFPFQIRVVGGSRDAADGVAERIGTFLKAQGFRVADSGAVIRIDVEIGQKFLRTESIANRVEKVFAATGNLHVYEPAGNEVVALAVTWKPASYTQQHMNRKKAAGQALVLAADTVSAKFRSKFRRAFPTD